MFSDRSRIIKSEVTFGDFSVSEFYRETETVPPTEQTATNPPPPIITPVIEQPHPNPCSRTKRRWVFQTKFITIKHEPLLIFVHSSHIE